MNRTPRHVRGPFAWVYATLFLLLAVAPASAQVVFTITATADDDGFGSAALGGYTVGQSYTFVFTSAASFSSNSSNIFNSDGYYWKEETTTEDQMWVSVGGTGLQGSFIRPVTESYSPTSSFSLAANDGSSGYLYIQASNDDSLPNIGLTTLNSTGIYGVSTSLLISHAVATPATYVEPFNASTGYLAANTYLGSYTPTTDVTLQVSIGSTDIPFTVTNLTISAAAVPEPSTYAAFAGLAALGFVAYRRHRTANT